MNAIITQTRTAFDDEIKTAMYDAVCDGEGHSTAFYLKRHLAKHGLVIVEAREYDRMLTALQFIGSCADTRFAAVASAARNALAKGA
jgi:hypothetical protein